MNHVSVSPTHGTGPNLLMELGSFPWSDLGPSENQVMATGTEYLQFLPVVLCLFALIAFITAYGLAVQEKDVSALWPYISDAGAQPPQSCIFGQLLNLAAVIGFAIIFVHYHHVRESNITGLPLIQSLNYWSLWIGGLSCLGMSIVANFQVVNSLAVHMVGAIMIFALGMVYCWMQAIVSYKMRSQATSSTLSSVTRFVLAFLVTVFLIITFSAGTASVAAYTKHHKNATGVSRYEIKWKETDDGYQAHLASTFSEWLMAFCFLVYFMTFFRELQKVALFIQVRPKNAEIFSPETQDDARVL
ncbi:DNA damage-regulated autophagy modulator protein 1-like isoform X1 [Montipora foliosa]|uniref:DNA damage-regulated autophagy modulator protein 1-like isoform X1 n=2 Tax=Montipora foliosa TaxID=591990 RepID=UPI0035F125B0